MWYCVVDCMCICVCVIFQRREEHCGDRLWLWHNPDCCHEGSWRWLDSSWGLCIFYSFFSYFLASSASFFCQPVYHPPLKSIISSLSLICLLLLSYNPEFQRIASLCSLFTAATLPIDLPSSHKPTTTAVIHLHFKKHVHTSPLLWDSTDRPDSMSQSYFCSHILRTWRTKIAAPLFHPQQNITMFCVQLNQAGLALPGNLKELQTACRRLPSSVLATVEQ